MDDTVRCSLKENKNSLYFNKAIYKKNIFRSFKLSTEI
jgi:hypothetical protein